MSSRFTFLFFIVIALLSGLFAVRHLDLSPYTGDEPHYLVIAKSLLSDGDVNVRNNYEQRDYDAFFSRPVAGFGPHISNETTETVWLPSHMFGLPLLLIPGILFAGAFGVTLTLILLYAWGVTELQQFLAFYVSNRVATGIAFLAAFSPPFILYAGRVFPDIVAAAFVIAAIRRVETGRGWGGVWIIGLAAAVMPWLHPRLLTLSLAIVLVALIRSHRNGIITGIMTATSYGLMMLALWATYGSSDPRVLFGGGGLELPTLWPGTLGQLFDAEKGLIHSGPLFAIGLVALMLVLFMPGFARYRGLALRLGFVVAAAWVPGSLSYSWWGGFSTPPRFTISVLLLLVVPFALLAQAMRRTVVASLACIIVLVTGARFAHAYANPTRSLPWGFGYAMVLEDIEPVTGPRLLQIWPSFAGMEVEWRWMDAKSPAVTQTIGRRINEGRAYDPTTDGPVGVLAEMPPRVLPSGTWHFAIDYRARDSRLPIGSLEITEVTLLGSSRIANVELKPTGGEPDTLEATIPVRGVERFGMPAYYVVRVLIDERSDAAVLVSRFGWAWENDP